MSIELITLLFFSTLVILLMLGLPVAFCVGGVSVVFIMWRLGPGSLYLIPSTAWEGWTNYILITIPLFVFMAFLIEQSGMADDLYEAMYRTMSSLRGGLAIGTVIICTIFAAMAGNSAVGTITMGLVALPSMLKRGYNKDLAVGCISAGGTLGILIPPSVPMIVYGFLAQESVGQLFMGGVFPGLLMSAIFVTYIIVRCRLNPQLGPPVPVEERFTTKQKLATLKAVILPVMLIIIVLGFMYLGVTTATEAAGIGAIGSLAIVFIYRRFSMKLLHNSVVGTLKITAMAGWIMVGAMLFTHVYASLGAGQFVTNIITGWSVNRWLIMIGIQVILLFLGCFMDPIGIMVIMIPIFVPVIKTLGFDPIWFGILFVINLEIGYLTPPFGVNLFYMKMLVPKNISMGDIIKSISPYVVLMVVCLGIVMAFPDIVLWLPHQMMGK